MEEILHLHLRQRPLSIGAALMNSLAARATTTLVLVPEQTHMSLAKTKESYGGWRFCWGFSTRVLEVYFSNDIRFQNMVGFCNLGFVWEIIRKVTDFSLVGVFREIFVLLSALGWGETALSRCFTGAFNGALCAWHARRRVVWGSNLKKTLQINRETNECVNFTFI